MRAGYARVAAVVLLGILGACSGGSGEASRMPPSTHSPTPRATSMPPAPPCPAPTLAESTDAGLPEIRGAATGATLWALVFHNPVTVDDEAKIVWRMTGSGSVRFAAHGPSGQVVEPEWGPESHAGSTWNRPGAEWGTGWVFPEPGCWRIDVIRSGQGRGVVSITVVPGHSGG